MVKYDDSTLTVTNVVAGHLAVGQIVHSIRVSRKSWAIWWERIRTLRWAVPTMELKDIEIKAIDTSEGIHG